MTAVTCLSLVLPTMQTTGVFAASRAFSVTSSFAATPRRRVMPNAATFACFGGRAYISRKKASSFGLLTGKPPSMQSTPSSSSLYATCSLSSSDRLKPSPCVPSRSVVS